MVFFMKQKILSTIREQGLLSRDMHIIVGLSGGPDSVCLFDVLCKLAEEMNWTLHGVHVNHLFRPGDAEKDQAFAEEFCRQRGVECTSVVRDCNELAKILGKTSEEAGRIARYEAFSQCAEKLTEAGVPKDRIAIAVAHNADDQCETILFRIMRGTGVDGLAGIPYRRMTEDGFKIVRPLLDVKRSEIEKYCGENNLNPCIDKTNAQNIYTRNKIRNLLIPYIEENFNSNIIETVNRLSMAAACDREYLWEQADVAYKNALVSENDTEVKLMAEPLSQYHKALRMRVFSKALQQVGMSENLSAAHLEGVDELLTAESPSAECHLTDGFKAFRQYDKIVFSAGGYDFEEESLQILTMSHKEYKEYKQKGLFHGAFSGADAEKLQIRERKDGDRIRLAVGTKKLQDFLVDEKVPKQYRDRIKVLALGNEILWVLPSDAFDKASLREKGRFSADYKVSEKDGDNIIVLEYKTKM